MSKNIRYTMQEGEFNATTAEGWGVCDGLIFIAFGSPAEGVEDVICGDLDGATGERNSKTRLMMAIMELTVRLYGYDLGQEEAGLLGIVKEAMDTLLKSFTADRTIIPLEAAEPA